MTDFDAATARTTQMRLGAAMCILFASIGLAGCETAGNILGGGGVATESVASAPAQAPLKPQMLASISLAPIIGAPDSIGQQLRSQVIESAGRSKIGIVADRDPSADFGMRGYLVAARDRGGIKVSYIWDITDKSGKRVNRITGEETVAGSPKGKEPWDAVTPAITQAVADKVASSLGAWVPNQPRGIPVASGAPDAGPPAGAGALPRAAAAVASPPEVTNTTTASVAPVGGGGGGGGMPIVTGAPGDGNTALASALNRELVRQGMPLDRQTGQAYRVEGQVALGPVKDGRQTIQIDWRVKDAKGGSVGTVTQKNAIPPGSLDGSWGQTADAAAAAAAQGILKLLPQQSASKATN